MIESKAIMAAAGSGASNSKVTTACTNCLLDASIPSVSKEVCGNGLDDDADGNIDNGCDCTVGSSQRCFRGDRALAGVGICKWGVQKCAGDDSSEFRGWGECREQGRPGNEQCGDMLDNDCDGEVDEDCGCKDGAREVCTSVCGEGERICKDRVFSACSARAPSEETCNGVDDDCDGKVDDIAPESCSSQCGSGQRSCVNGSWSSCSAPTGEAEECNGIDDDCDGVIDDVADMPCSNACGSGRRRCVSGSWSSCSAPDPEPETCNGRDDDCDGRIDDIADVACNSACGSGVRSCVDGEWLSCSAPAPKTEICNDVDDDCDGEVDDGLSATFTFENLCTESRMFIVFGGCNVCSGTCNGFWVDPGDSIDYRVAQDTCFIHSVFARTPDGDVCLDENGAGDYVGETRELCNKDCHPQTIRMRANRGNGC